MLDNTIFFLLDEVEYTFDIYDAEILPNGQLKYNILTEQNQSVYCISNLSFAITDHTINASDVQIQIQPARLDYITRRLGIQIHAATTDSMGEWMSKCYNNLEIRSLCGIYDTTADKMVVHVSYSTILPLLLQ